MHRRALLAASAAIAAAPLIRTAGAQAVKTKIIWWHAMTVALGQEAPGFPKFTGGWMVDAPAVGPFGTLGTQVMAAGTREGELFVWKTPRAACASSGPWPKMHHDLWNTSDLSESGAPAPRCAP